MHLTFTQKKVLLTTGCVLLVVCAPFWGMTVISPFSLLESGSPEAEVFWRLRLPRAVAAFLSGAGLGVSGMVFQAMFRNPLATPFTLGVSSGAAFGASVYFRFSAPLLLLGGAGSLGAALCGGLLSMLMVYLITRARGGFSTSVMLLAGVIINFFFSSLVAFVQFWSNANDSLRIMHWLMGSLAGLEIARLADLAFIIVAGALLIFRLSPELDLLTAGDELAASRGVAVRQAKVTLFIVASVMVGAVVSLGGPIGFVGMMTPHICRLWLGWAHRQLLPATFVLGGSFLTLCDLLARTALAPAEIPIGIITALIGAPFFLWTLFRANQKGELF
ncbi:MAG: iron ABC transporter permease [Desulfovibrio sp.]|jgi:iron complex transport system permease protein|nr:iron ABC transporter permease [Desulfovibrio sp.]